MGLYPVFLILKNKSCLVVGGGAVAERKIKSLLEAEAVVTLVSPTGTDQIQQLAASGELEWFERSFREDDLDEVFLVVAATNSKMTNKAIFEASERRNIPVNAVDEPEHCSFFVPARIIRGDLQVAVSTSGKAPYFARKLKEHLESLLYVELEQDLEKIHASRMNIINTIQDEKEKKRAMRAAIDPIIDEILKSLEGK